MGNSYFRFKQFTIHQDRSAMKVTTDSCLFGAWVADVLQHENSHGNFLDIGAGTGLLSLMVAQKTEAVIDAVEVDNEAAVQAEENFSASPWKNRLHPANTSIQEFSAGKNYDQIFCNPPFYENELKPIHHGRHLAHHSKALLLVEVIAAIKKQLKDDGSFFLLLPAFRSDEAVRLLGKENYQVQQKILVRQTEKHTAFRVMLRGGRNAQRLDDSEIIIMEKQRYSEVFTALLKDYYLAL